MQSTNVCVFTGIVGNADYNEEKQILSFSFALSYQKKDDNNKKVEKTDWIKVVKFNANKKFADYIKKGVGLSVTAHISTNVYQLDEEEKQRKEVFFVADQINFLPFQSK